MEGGTFNDAFFHTDAFQVKACTEGGEAKGEREGERVEGGGGGGCL